MQCAGAERRVFQRCLAETCYIKCEHIAVTWRKHADIVLVLLLKCVLIIDIQL